VADRILRELVGKKSVKLTDAERRRFAAKGEPLDRKLLGQIATFLTPDTILRRNRRLIAMKWPISSSGRVGHGLQSRSKR
jgi:hypothetical protein